MLSLYLLMQYRRDFEYGDLLPSLLFLKQPSEPFHQDLFFPHYLQDAHQSHLKRPQFLDLRSQLLAYLTQVQILSEKWSCWQYCGLTSDIYFCRRYLFLWEGSPEPDSIAVWRRLLQFVFKVEWSGLKNLLSSQ